MKVTFYSAKMTLQLSLFSSKALLYVLDSLISFTDFKLLQEYTTVMTLQV